ncbi:MAG: SDR family NAD(P)-dependent oxidoreductase [Acidimicrobiia bacterium]|nr:SDR family NAD(P)-dependent oxidoreductase [Acidimicrobiia bacterium]
MELAGATVLLTGASSGIGEQLAPQLAAAGAAVGIVARRADRLEAVLAACQAHTPDSAMWSADLSDVDVAVQIADEARERFGHIDVLVNNAAIGKRKLVQTLTADDIDTTMRTNFTSPIRMAMALIPHMVERGDGLIVNVSSMGGRLGIAHEAAYCASKFAMSGWSESARIDLHGTGVNVKLVLPGPIATEIWELQPGELPGLYDGPFVSAADCAADIVRAIEDPDGFEYYTPELVPGGWAQRDLVVGKTQNCDQFLTGMAAMTASPE